MELQEVKEIIQLVEKSSFVNFELDVKKEFYIKLSKNSGVESLVNKQQPKDKPLENLDYEFNNKESLDKISETLSEPVTLIPKEKSEVKEGNLIKSPIVGTFYSSSSPDNPPYVKIGDKVKIGDTLCIVEAMKVMNEITSKFEGEVVEILVNNEEIVEYNQPLFRIV